MLNYEIILREECELNQVTSVLLTMFPSKIQELNATIENAKQKFGVNKRISSALCFQAHHPQQQSTLAFSSCSRIHYTLLSEEGRQIINIGLVLWQVKLFPNAVFIERK